MGLLLISTFILVTCTNSVGPGTPEPPTPTQIVEVLPTQQVTPAAAPEAPTAVPTTISVPTEPETAGINPTPSESPEAEGTRIPDEAIISAAAEQNVELTPTAIAEFVPVPGIDVEGKRVMIRIDSSDNSVQVIVITNEKTVEFFNIPDGTIEETPEDTLVIRTDGKIDLVIDKGTGTATPTAEAAPTPEEGTEEAPGTPESPFTAEQLNSLDNTWPIQFPENSDHTGFLSALRGESSIQFVHINLGIIIAKVISNIHYIDASGNEQGAVNKIWIVDGGLANVNNNWYVFFGPRSLYTNPLSQPDSFQSQSVIDHANDYFLNNWPDLGSDYRYGNFGEGITIKVLESNSQMPDVVFSNPNGNSAFATYEFVRDYDISPFLATGDPQYLPKFPEGTFLPNGTDISGNPFIPSLGVEPIVTN